MTVVVVPLDGSEFAERALRPACALAARMPAGRVLVLRCEPSDPTQAAAYLRERAELFSGVVEVDVRIVEDVAPVPAILETLASDPDSLLCMTSHGRGGLRNAVLGSTADAVVCRATREILLVGPDARTTLLPGEDARMVVCSDGSRFSEAILAPASRWATALDLEPWVVESIGPDEEVTPPGQPARHPLLVETEARLELLAGRMGESRRPARTSVLHGAPAARSITSFAARLPAGLIAMATHGRAGIIRSAMGSVAADVVRRAPCPVLLLRSEDADQEA